MLFDHKTIEGSNLLLVPFEDSHIDGLRTIAINEQIWQQLPTKLHSDKDFDEYIATLKSHIEMGIQYIYTIIDKKSSEILGATHFFGVDIKNKKLEIGNTWLNPKAWGTKVNMEAKYMLLNFCFEKNDIQRVELRTRETNIRSQKAIEKIGGVKEGILRQDRVNEDGTFRNTMLYSIVRSDWADLKMRLEKALAED
jgi:RimJ/RimL family protein N-acetyltransferase